MSPVPVSANRTHGPRGFFTSPNKKGIGPGTLLQKHNYGHMIDEYDRKRDLDREERRLRKTHELGRPFTNVVKGRKTFGNDYDEYGEDRLDIKSKKPPKPYDGLKHPGPWKYTNESRHIRRTINEHPEYAEEKLDVDPSDRLKNKRDTLPWRPTYNRRSKPDDSIAQNYKNRPKYSFM